DGPPPAGLVGCELEEPLADAAMEVEVERGLEPVASLSRLPAQPYLRGDVQQQREVRHDAASSDGRDRPEILEWQSRTVTLVGERRVGEAGADDDLPGGERRFDHLRDQ